MFAKFLAAALLTIGVGTSAGIQAADIPVTATVLDPDIVWDVANPDSFALSRDGKQIAYISKGALWVCGVDAGPATKLTDLPYTITAILAEPANKAQRAESAASPHNIRHRVFYGPIYTDRHYVIGLAWTPDQQGLVYTVRKRARNDSPVGIYQVMYVSLKGAVEELTVIEGQFGIPDEYTTSMHVTADRKFVVAASYYPLIWDVEANRPQATPYDLLVPSETSDRFLGIEIDTRQLVLVDEQFRIAKRFDVIFPVDQTVDLTWSADERFAVYRIHDKHPSNVTTAFRIDLQTDEQLEIGKSKVPNRFVFIGQEGELLHLRIAAARVWGYTDGELGTKLTVIDQDGTHHDLFTTEQIRKPQKGQKGETFPPMVAASDGSHVAAAVPRPEGQLPGAYYHLIDRDGTAKPFTPLSDDNYITPYYPITFADEGQRLIARSGATLFSIPVSGVAQAAEAKDE